MPRGWCVWGQEGAGSPAGQIQCYIHYGIHYWTHHRGAFTRLAPWPLLVVYVHRCSVHHECWWVQKTGNWEYKKNTLIARFMGPTWGPSGADRTQMGHVLAPLTLLSGYINGLVQERRNSSALAMELHLSLTHRYIVSKIFFNLLL